MKPINFPLSNVVFGQNQNEYHPLPAYSDDAGNVYTKWELSAEDLQEVAKTGVVYLIVHTFGGQLQPVILTTENPFLDEEEVMQ